MVNNHCKYITHYFHDVSSVCRSHTMLFLFLFLRYVEGSITIATSYQET